MATVPTKSARSNDFKIEKPFAMSRATLNQFSQVHNCDRHSLHFSMCSFIERRPNVNVSKVKKRAHASDSANVRHLINCHSGVFEINFAEGNVCTAYKLVQELCFFRAFNPFFFCIRLRRRLCPCLSFSVRIQLTHT